MCFTISNSNCGVKQKGPIHRVTFSRGHAGARSANDTPLKMLGQRLSRPAIFFILLTSIRKGGRKGMLSHERFTHGLLPTLHAVALDSLIIGDLD